MNQNVKFKAVVNETKLIYSVSYLDFYNKKVTLIETDDFADSYLGFELSLDDVTLLPFTGFTDKYNVDIYDKDIIEINYQDKKIMAIVEVNTLEGILLKEVDGDYIEDVEKILYKSYKRVKVVGNSLS